MSDNPVSTLADQDGVGQRLVRPGQGGLFHAGPDVSDRLIPLWGLVEDRLNSTLAMVWDGLLDHPEKEIAAVLEDHLAYLAQQLDNTLKSR